MKDSTSSRHTGGPTATATRLNRSAAQPHRVQPWRPRLLQGTWTLLLVVKIAQAEPFVPLSGDQVLERLRTTALDSEAQELRDLRARLRNDPRDLGAAKVFALKCIEHSRRESDPRFLGRAQAALEPWWNHQDAPAEVLVLRATIRQSQHDFAGALKDLDLALAVAPRNVQAWLTRATILTVLGDYASAKRACVPLAQLAPGLVALTAAANVACLNGEAERGCALLRSALEAHPEAAKEEKVWTLTILGESFARLGRNAEAEGCFKSALQFAPHDPYLLASFADLLLDQGRPQEVISLLKDPTRADGLLLRVVLAQSQLDGHSSQYLLQRQTLNARFEEGHLRGDFVHQREEARFALQVLAQPHAALRIAQANWSVQHEPADARLLLESALAAHDPAAARPALDFIRTNRVQDIRLKPWLDQLQKAAP